MVNYVVLQLSKNKLYVYLISRVLAFNAKDENAKDEKKSFFHKTSFRKKKKKLRVHTHIIKKNNFQGSQTRARELERERERERE